MDGDDAVHSAASSQALQTLGIVAQEIIKDLMIPPDWPVKHNASPLKPTKKPTVGTDINDNSNNGNNSSSSEDVALSDSDSNQSIGNDEENQDAAERRIKKE